MPKDKRRSPLALSRTTNVQKMIDGADGRSSYMRRWRDIQAAHTSDLGGDDQLSQAKRSIIRNIATMSAQLEAYDRRFADAGMAPPEELDLYCRVSGHRRRLMESIGMEREAKDITPHLADYLLEEKA